MIRAANISISRNTCFLKYPIRYFTPNQILYNNNNSSVINSKSPNVIHSNPSTKTSIILNELPRGIVEKDVKAVLKDIKYTSLDLEPGCSLHFLHKNDVDTSASFIKKNFKLDVSTKMYICIC